MKNSETANKAQLSQTFSNYAEKMDFIDFIIRRQTSGSMSDNEWYKEQ